MKKKEPIRFGRRGHPVRLACHGNVTPPKHYKGPVVRLSATSTTTPGALICDVEVQYEHKHTWDVTEYVAQALQDLGKANDDNVYIWEYKDNILDESFARRKYRGTQRVYKWRKNPDGSTTFR